MNENEIENLLRKAPRPAAHPQLKGKLEAGIALPRSRSVRPQQPEQSLAESPWRRSIPALSFGVLLLGCLVVLGVQGKQLLELRREKTELRSVTANLDRLRQDNAELQRLQLATQEAERLKQQQEELVRLRAEVARLRGTVQELPALRSEGQRLQAEHAAAAAKAGIAEEDPAAEAKSRADRIACVNNLKQIALGALLYASDNKNVIPPDFLTMSNELNTPKLLTCPGDSGRKPVANWQVFDGSSVSYEFLSPGVTDTDPDIVLVRCPIHFNVGMLDGSVQQLSITNQRIEKVYGKFKIVRIQKTTPR